MKRELVVLLTSVLLMASMTAAQAAEPALTVEEARLDLGTIKAGSDAVGVFTFHNTGDEDVKIIRAKPS